MVINDKNQNIQPARHIPQIRKDIPAHNRILA
jgi:hypothetical protein